MRAGQLRRRITLQQLVAGSPQQLDTGEPDESWTTLVTVWGRIRQLSGRELFLAQQVASRVNTEIVIRYRSDITAAMRALDGSTVYSIEAVIEDERRTMLMLRCSKGVNQG